MAPNPCQQLTRVLFSVIACAPNYPQAAQFVKRIGVACARKCCQSFSRAGSMRSPRILTAWEPPRLTTLSARQTDGTAVQLRRNTAWHPITLAR
jgi:hypothetical protein